jgi:putative oxidoreductase
MKNKILFVVSLLFGLMFINAGLNMFLHYMPMPKEMPEQMSNFMKVMMELGWFMPLLGVSMLLGGILVIPGKTRALGAIIIFPMLVGILLIHIFNSPKELIMALVLMAINLWIIYENKEKYIPMINA